MYKNGYKAHKSRAHPGAKLGLIDDPPVPRLAMTHIIPASLSRPPDTGFGLQVLVVDDDPDIRQLICDYLAKYAIRGIGATDGQSMQQQLATHPFDAVILDLMLPGENGLQLCKQLRSHSDLPVLMISARNEPTERIISLEIGADDFLAKPFDIRELVARLHSVLRRSRGHRQHGHPGSGYQHIRFGDWLLNSTLRQLHSQDGLVVPLSSAEFRLLSVMLKRPRTVLDREILLDLTRGNNVDVFDRSIDILVSRLRSKLGDDPRNPTLIRTVRGEGYMLDAHTSPA